MSKLLKRLFLGPIKRLGVTVLNRFERWSEAELPVFATQPKNLTIARPRRIVNAERILVGDNVIFGPGSLLIAQKAYPTPFIQDPDRPRPIQRFDSRIVIGNRVTSTGYLTLSAFNSITVEDDVMFASNVFINDGFHGFENANEPYKYQPIFRIAPIVIRRGSWIGQNVVILPGVTVGELAIIGANSVVTKNIPPQCIAFGAPAKVVKRWNATEGKWVLAD